MQPKNAIYLHVSQNIVNNRLKGLSQPSQQKLSFACSILALYIHHNQKAMDVEMGTFTPLVFGTNGGMGLDCQNFLRTLANKLSTKNNEPYASVISWLRIQLSFDLLIIIIIIIIIII